MIDFTFHLRSGEKKYIGAHTIHEAAEKLDMAGPDLSMIVAYDKNGVHDEIAGQAQCGCWHHAEEGISCRHDLERVGLTLQEDA